MGRDKGLLDFGGTPLLVHTVRLLESLVGAVTIVGSPRRYSALGVRAITDSADSTRVHAGREPHGRGPLAGIRAALSATRSRWNLIVACDMPYLSSEWLDWLLSRAAHSRAEAVVPRTARGLEPLAAVYRHECGGPIAVALARGIRKVTTAIEDFRLEIVSPRDWRHIDSAGLVLRNMNALGDYKKALDWWAARDSRVAKMRAGRHLNNSPRASRRTKRSAPRPRK